MFTRRVPPSKHTRLGEHRAPLESLCGKRTPGNKSPRTAAYLLLVRRPGQTLVVVAVDDVADDVQVDPLVGVDGRAAGEQPDHEPALAVHARGGRILNRRLLRLEQLAGR